MTVEKKVIINKADNVGVCLEACGEIPAGHKYALSDIGCGETVIKYGQVIGRASRDIKAGEWVHTHNVRSHLDETPVYEYHYAANEPEKKPGGTFMGYLRSDGSVGIRNEIYILPTVGCVNNVCMRLEKEARRYQRGSIDGIYAMTHQFLALCNTPRNAHLLYLFVCLASGKFAIQRLRQIAMECFRNHRQLVQP